MKVPEISIITPFQNAEHFIPGFIECLRQQTFTNWIAILVDDHSTDNGLQLLRKITHGDDRFLVLSNPHQGIIRGPALARNIALSYVQTKLITFCDIDDLWHPEKLSLQRDFHISHQLDLSVTYYCRFTDQLHQGGAYHVTRPPQISSIQSLLARNYIPMLTVMVSSSLLQNHYFLDMNHEDFHYWISLYKKNPHLRYGCLKKVLAFYRVHENNLSGNKLMMLFWTYLVYRRLSYNRAYSLYLVGRWLISHILELITCNLPDYKRTYILQK